MEIIQILSLNVGKKKNSIMDPSHIQVVDTCLFTAVRWFFISNHHSCKLTKESCVSKIDQKNLGHAYIVQVISDPVCMSKNKIVVTLNIGKRSS